MTRDKTAKILILDTTLDTDQYILINLNNVNTETEQTIILEKFMFVEELKYPSRACNFNLSFDSILPGVLPKRYILIKKKFFEINYSKKKMK